MAATAANLFKINIAGADKIFFFVFFFSRFGLFLFILCSKHNTC